jgi:hypothetical protein
MMVVTIALSTLLVPLGLLIMLRGLLDLTARRSSMVGQVVGMRRDNAVFGRTYRIAVQSGDRAMARGLWAESFRVDRATFQRLKPGDRLSVEYSPRLRYVYAIRLAEPLKRVAG